MAEEVKKLNREEGWREIAGKMFKRIEGKERNLRRKRLEKSKNHNKRDS